MGKVIRIPGRRKRRKRQRCRRRRPAASRLPLAMPVAAAAALWVFANPYTNPADARRIAGNADFALCGWSRKQDCVVDGDTIRYGSAKIRLLDINAPETGDPGCAYERALGGRATRRLLALMNAGPFEVVYRGGRDRDRYGRKLRLIVRNGRSLGDTLIAEGLARPWSGARRSWCG